MNYEELFDLDKKCIRTRKTRILMIPIVFAFFALVSIIIISTGLLKTLPVIMVAVVVAILFSCIAFIIVDKKYQSNLAAFEKSILDGIGVSEWKYNTRCDAYIDVKSKQAVYNFDEIKFFKGEEGRLAHAVETIQQKKSYKKALSNFLADEKCKNFHAYKTIALKAEDNLQYLDDYYVVAHYSSPTGKSQAMNTLTIPAKTIRQLINDKSLLMSKSEYTSYMKEQTRQQLEKKQHSFYEMVNAVIDCANENKEKLVNVNDSDELDRLISSLFDRTVNSIKKVKSLESEEWAIIDKYIKNTNDDVNKIIQKNNQIIEYYKSKDFLVIKNTCDTLMATQKEFNEYIDEKVKSISDLFGTSVVRNETSFEDEYKYIHPYKKSITPFTAEVSANVFASAENNPIEYVVKHFYPDKGLYPEQIRKLQLLIEELETLKDAKVIIENYKKDIQKYLSDVPSFIMENDEDGFYSRLGFATINENNLTVAYKFSYTSNGGRAQRSFTIPMTEETIVKLIEMLESKLTMSAFTKEQRSLMTSKLRQRIKERDAFTCKSCGNSTYKEPNLLLEIDHIIPVSKGGCTEEGNLQTLCWKCNRSKSDKTI